MVAGRCSIQSMIQAARGEVPRLKDRSAAQASSVTLRSGQGRRQRPTGGMVPGLVGIDMGMSENGVYPQL